MPNSESALPGRPAALVHTARRSGPLPYSALGPTRPPPDPPGPPGADPSAVAWLAASIDRWWAALGRPDPYVVVETQAGDGARAAAVLRAGLACTPALRYVLVGSSGAPAAPGLVVESPALALGPVRPDHDDEDRAEAIPGVGPLVTAVADLPRVEAAGVVLATGWLSGQPADRFQRGATGWEEVRLAAAGRGLQELLVQVPRHVEAELDRLVGDRVAPGQRVELAVGARAWFLDALGTLDDGLLVVVDAFSRLTDPLGAGPPTLPLDQLVPLRRPAEPPARAFGPWDVVTWRLGRAVAGRVLPR